MVNISLRVLARPVAENLPSMYQKLGTDYDERVLPSICNEVNFIDHVFVEVCYQMLKKCRRVRTLLSGKFK